MQEQEWTPMTTQETPPISHFRRHMDNALAGLIMTMFTLNVLGLNYLLYTVGALLMVTAFRALRKTNRSFFTCYVLSIVKAALHLPSLILNATIYSEAFSASILSTVVNYAGVIVTVLLIFFLRSGIREAQKSVEIAPHSGSVTCMLLFALLFFTNMQLSGFLVLIVLLVAVIIVVRCLFGLVRELEEAGYAVEPLPVRIPDGKLVQAIVILLAAGIVCGYLFGNRYPMDWQVVAHDEHAEVTEIKAQLLELGFPEYVLNDLTATDIFACEGALEVVVQTEDHPVNDGREVWTSSANYTQVETVYDVEELRITGVSVRLPEERQHWKIFQHFLWTVDPGFYGTEALQIWPACRSDMGWDLADPYTGRVLYNSGDTVFTASYHSLGSDTYTTESFLWGPSQQTDVFATFSMPRKGELHRGYVSYGVQEMREGAIVDGWLNYIHQDSRLQYPVQTAKQYRMNGGMFSQGAFRIIQDALQFYPAKEGTELIG